VLCFYCRRLKPRVPILDKLIAPDPAAKVRAEIKKAMLSNIEPARSRPVADLVKTDVPAGHGEKCSCLWCRGGRR